MVVPDRARTRRPSGMMYARHSARIRRHRGPAGSTSVYCAPDLSTYSTTHRHRTSRILVGHRILSFLSILYCALMVWNLNMGRSETHLLLFPFISAPMMKPKGSYTSPVTAIKTAKGVLLRVDTRRVTLSWLVSSPRGLQIARTAIFLRASGRLMSVSAGLWPLFVTGDRQIPPRADRTASLPPQNSRLI